jgi:hypothetical protein
MTFLDLFRPGQKHSDWRVRRASVEKIADPAVLADVAKNDSTGEVRQAAFRKLIQHPHAKVDVKVETALLDQVG